MVWRGLSSGIAGHGCLPQLKSIERSKAPLVIELLGRRELFGLEIHGHWGGCLGRLHLTLQVDVQERCAGLCEPLDGHLIDLGGTGLAGLDDLPGSLARDREGTFHAGLGVGLQHLANRRCFVGGITHLGYIQGGKTVCHGVHQFADLAVDGADSAHVIGCNLANDRVDVEPGHFGGEVKLTGDAFGLGDRRVQLGAVLDQTEQAKLTVRAHGLHCAAGERAGFQRPLLLLGITHGALGLPACALLAGFGDVLALKLGGEVTNVSLDAGTQRNQKTWAKD